MAVAFDSTIPAVTHANASSITSGNWTISGPNPAMVVEIVFNSTTITVSSVTWSLGAGTPVQIAIVRGGSGFATTSAIWAVPAPTTGTGTLQVTLSSGVDFVFNADNFTGADQTTPCPSGDAQTDTTTAASLTLTPTNLTANDATAGCGASTANVTSASPHQTMLTNAPAVGEVAGYATGTTGLTTVISGTGNDRSRAAVRIVAVSAGGSRGLFQPPPLTGMGQGGSGYFSNPLAAPIQMRAAA